MKKRYSLFSCLCIGLFYLSVRTVYSDFGIRPNLRLTTWDALGYYMYLPATLIYRDVKNLEWFPAIDAQYNLSGGELYQAVKHENGNYYFKYLSGVSLLSALKLSVKAGGYVKGAFRHIKVTILQQQ